MSSFIDDYWRELQLAEPGERFQRLLGRRRAGRRAIVSRIICVAGGVLVMVVGLVLLFVPGPGTLLLFAGAALMAQESLWVARAMDWLELQGRRAFRGVPIARRRTKTPKTPPTHTPRRSASKP